MAVNLSCPNFVLLPGLVPNDLTPFVSFFSSIKDQINIILVTEASCVDNVKPLHIFPNLYVHILSTPDDLADQHNQSRDVRLYQWYKYNRCLKVLQHLEGKYSFTANRLFKLRLDYIYSNIDALTSQILDNKSLVDDCLFCESDRIFFGSRLTMFSLRHFLDLAVALFLNKADYYYPIHFQNLSKSSLNVTRWERLNFDRRVFDCPSVKDLYSDPSYIQSLLSSKDIPPVPPSPEDVYSFHTGNLVLPAERSFAWFLNVNGIIPRHHPSMSGAIYR